MKWIRSAAGICLCLLLAGIAVQNTPAMIAGTVGGVVFACVYFVLWKKGRGREKEKAAAPGIEELRREYDALLVDTAARLAQKNSAGGDTDTSALAAENTRGALMRKYGYSAHEMVLFEDYFNRQKRKEQKKL